jgi:hypothetical protein
MAKPLKVSDTLEVVESDIGAARGVVGDGTMGR